MNDTAGPEVELLSDPQAQLRRWQVPDFGSPSEPLTAQQIDDIERAAYDEGHQRGYDDGYRAGQALVQQQAQRLRGLLEHLSRPLQHLDDEVEQLLSDLACGVARRILDAELELKPERVLELLRSAMSALPEDLRELRLDVSPQDAELVRAQLQPPPECKRLRVHEDAQLAPGDCRLHTENIYVDARLDARVTQLRQGLHEARR
ncbi:flagellar assembly protein FliH [Solimonas aquatica]|uniref:Flagellar assembly protein FliH n=1 Tax=Solimonas aquatica TaxID=489703 RepID=A0A1H9HJJ2_9GAMM|nr:FliH/SctL family protein [Solimonas aquatica]SEQ62510.1 flagellar assembly protein FliH [Solimonas aquatica]